MLGSSPEIAGLISDTRIFLSARKDLPAGANLCAIFTISLSDHRTTSADSDASLPSDLLLQKGSPADLRIAPGDSNFVSYFPHFPLHFQRKPTLLSAFLFISIGELVYHF